MRSYSLKRPIMVVAFNAASSPEAMRNVRYLRCPSNAYLEMDEGREIILHEGEVGIDTSAGIIWWNMVRGGVHIYSNNVESVQDY